MAQPSALHNGTPRDGFERAALAAFRLPGFF
jgi:hypothetical protein